MLSVSHFHFQTHQFVSVMTGAVVLAINFSKLMYTYVEAYMLRSLSSVVLAQSSRATDCADMLFRHICVLCDGGATETTLAL
jgi:hypothetical protein